MSGYTSGNNAPTLMTQNANRKGNAFTRVASHNKGVTAVTNPMGGLAQPKGAQGAPKCMGASNNTSIGATGGRKQKVMVETNCTYDGKIHNDGYMNSDRTNYLK
jgi:hypothetical protein